MDGKGSNNLFSYAQMGTVEAASSHRQGLWREGGEGSVVAAVIGIWVGYASTTTTTSPKKTYE
jgi:hypothetical protein